MIGKRDFALLKELNKNARVPDSQIAKKLKISKQAVGYRIRRLQEKGIIRNFFTEFSPEALGWGAYYVFLELENITNTEEQNLINRLSSEENVGWIIRALGKANIVLLCYAQSIQHFEWLFSWIKQCSSAYLHAATFSMRTSAQRLSYQFLENELKAVGGGEKTIVDFEDKRLMRAIAQNCRRSSVKISQETRLSLDKVRYRLRKLEKEKVICGYRTRLDVSILGYQWYLVVLQLQATKEMQRKNLLDYLRYQKEAYYLTTTVGSYDILVDVHVKNTGQVKEFLFRLRDKFPEVLKNYDLLLIFQEEKNSYLPKL